jgi:glycosyltransferase involved in cell wall biosynthesis
MPHGLPPGAGTYVWGEADRASLLDLMRRVVADPDGARDVGRRARQRIVDQFRWEHCAGKALERIRVLAHRRPRAAGLAGAGRLPV